MSPPRPWRKVSNQPRLTPIKTEAGVPISNQPHFIGYSDPERKRRIPGSYCVSGETPGKNPGGCTPRTFELSPYFGTCREPEGGKGLDPEVGRMSHKRDPCNHLHDSLRHTLCPKLRSHSPAARREEIGVVFVACTKHCADFSRAGRRKSECFQELAPPTSRNAAAACCFPAEQTIAWWPRGEETKLRRRWGKGK